VYGYLLGLVRDREVANDLFQETFMRAIAAMHARRGSYEQQGRWLSWIMRIARNAALDHLRSRKKWQDVLSDGDFEGETFWDALPDDGCDVEQEFVNKENGEMLEACIASLPPEQREVLLLRHEVEMTFKEIAELTGCSINTALGRMRYALLNLRRTMNAVRTGKTRSRVS
jgi:RNA polymerase sigma-70 factor, ECF subfamily